MIGGGTWEGAPMLGMRRRDFVALLGGAAASAYRLRRSRTGEDGPHRFLGPRLGLKSTEPCCGATRRASRSRLGRGPEYLIEFRWAEGNYERLPALAEELVRLRVDVLVTHGAAGALAAKNASSTVPIVITAVGDMLSLGLVSSLSRPEGNITGSSLFVAEHTAKRLELIKEAIPSLTKVAVLLNPG